MGDLEKQETVLKKVEEEEKERFLEGNGKSVVDFDVLCSTVALQTQGKLAAKLQSFHGGEEDGDVGDLGGVFRMWEGEVLDCLDDRRIALESLCCPCYRFGKNMSRAGFGPCSLQGTLHLILAVLVILNCVAFIVTKKHCFIYLAVAFTISLGTYLGYFRTQMKKKFNIRGSDSSLDDCIYHLICPCCALCQVIILAEPMPTR
ncbi:PREDICTED: PLANT CADMIUM RESISTANCE [Prunus dulcis]|uniref:PREDICTED: PLANT CADMIUM RESISTANCE n=1 Tax=Prunus dulcis TaxID=3755 RepID=A0A5E4G4S3_PRUDU|nr:PREDICTED: PLANT CADMIUM RESISTANCE [Prunus dulcis]